MELPCNQFQFSSGIKLLETQMRNTAKKRWSKPLKAAVLNLPAVINGPNPTRELTPDCRSTLILRSGLAP